SSLLLLLKAHFLSASHIAPPRTHTNQTCLLHTTLVAEPWATNAAGRAGSGRTRHRTARPAWGNYTLLPTASEHPARPGSSWAAARASVSPACCGDSNS